MSATNDTPHPPSELFKLLIHKHLCENNMSIEDLASKGKIKYVTIHGWLRSDSTRIPKIDHVCRLCNVFGIDFFKEYYDGYNQIPLDNPPN